MSSIYILPRHILCDHAYSSYLDVVQYQIQFHGRSGDTFDTANSDPDVWMWSILLEVG
jgi:hypothetical protein